MIGILDMHMGNLRSVYNAVYELAFDPEMLEEAVRFDDLTHLIIPGDGNFGTAMRHLGEAGLIAPIRAFADSGRPVLGICVGMQLLASTGVEGGETPGLDLIAGKVTQLPNSGNLRLPHVGWNTAHVRHDHPVFEGLKPVTDFYFVHSFAMHCEHDENILAETDYGCRFACIDGHNNVIGFQFHAEKSQINGLTLLENFCNWNGEC